MAEEQLPEEKPAGEQPGEQSMKFLRCPNCGSEKRIIESAVKEEISKGNLKEGAKAVCMGSRTAIFDPADSGIIAPKKILMIQCLYDVCADCGTLYCIEMSRTLGFVHPQVRRDVFRHHPGGRG